MTLATTRSIVAATYRKLVAKVDAGQTADIARRSTIATRKAELAKAIASLDVEALAQVEQTFAEYVPNIATISAEDAPELTHEQVVALAAEYVRHQRVSEFLEVRKATIKGLVFQHFDNTVGTNVNGELPVPEVGKVLKREGAGITDPELNLDKLRAALGADAEKVFVEVYVPEQIIPARIEQTFSEEALINLAATKPEILDGAIRDSLIPGKAKTSKFIMRDYTA